ncbi:hypothetical protein BGZ68_010348 [Mortierella alpina]|nr:hypothetical protein BGZ68_010348 [Mortierella alpina]
MERRVSAGERVDHVLRVVQRRRTEQEMRQHKVRDELEQKMMRAMARRKEFLEAAIENDPSRRFRRKSASSNTAVVSERTRDRVRGSSSFSVAVAGLGSERLPLRRPVVVNSAAANTTTSPIIRNKTALVTSTTPNITERGQDGGQGPKNSGRMDIMKRKSHLTSMTSRSISPSTAANDLILDDSIIKSSPSDIEDKGASVDNLGLERTIVWAQRRIRTRLVQKASHEYMRAIGGSHQRVLALGFEDLARLLHSNKALVQAALRFLKYSSQLAQMDMEPSQRTKRAYKNPGRVLLSMYMVLAHPNQIRSPSETSASATGHHDDDDAFEALVESSKALLEALQTWMAANLKSQDDSTSSENENANDSATTPSSHSTADSQRNAALVRNFDQAWTSYFGFFEAWKNKDARRLLETLLEHARQLEALWRTVQSDAMARVEWQPRIEEQRRDLRAKAGQLAGPGGVARLDSVFADFVTTTTTTTTANSTVAAPDTDSATSNSNHTAETRTRASPTVEDAVMEETLTSSSGAKKRQRNASVSQSDTAMASADQASDTLATASRFMDSSLKAAEGNDTGTSAAQEPLPKKPATANPSAGTSTAKKTTKESTTDNHLTFELPTGFAKPEKWSNLRMLHEVALDPSLRIEQAPQGPDTDLVQRIEAMATKAYFDSIREDAAKGELGKWIPSILTSIRMQLLDMVPPGSATAQRVAEAFDLDFVQQQVDRKVYDVKAALEGVLDIMSKLCAPIRDPSIRQLQEDLQQVSQPSFQTEQGTSSSSDIPAPKYTATSVSPKDLVSVLQGILELLEQMLMDMANFRLIAARPKLEQQAIPYEQDAFKTMLADGETSLEATTAWLQTSATRFLSSKSTSPPSSPSVTAAASSSPGSGSPGSPSAKNGNRHYEVFANAVLDLLFAKKAVETLGKNEFPETFELDRMRLTRYQNEIQALLLVAVMMNLAFNSAPLVKAGEWSEELKSTVFKLMELSGTTKGQFADAIIEAKERALLVAARSGSSSSSSGSSSNPSSPTPASTVPVSHLLLTEDKKRSLHSSIAKAVSFDSPLYIVIAQRVRKVLERYLTSTSASGGMPDRAALNKVGLGFLEGELEVIAKPIRFLVKYNAKVYQQWYDPLLAKALTRASETLSKVSTEPAPAPASASSPTSSSSSSASSSSTSSDSRYNHGA